MAARKRKDESLPWWVKYLALVAAVAAIGAAILYAPGDAAGRTTANSMLAETVMIYNDSGHGSGVIVGPHVVLTAGHVGKMLDVSSGGQIKFSDGKSVPAHTLWIAETADVALVSIDDGSDHSARVAGVACRAPVAGEPITLAGNPLVIDQALTFGHVASSTSLSTFPLHPQDIDAETLQFFHTHWALDIAAAQGNSGGPIFDANGDVIGILAAGLVHEGASGLREFSSFVLMIPSSIFCGMRF